HTLQTSVDIGDQRSPDEGEEHQNPDREPGNQIVAHPDEGQRTDSPDNKSRPNRDIATPRRWSKAAALLAGDRRFTATLEQDANEAGDTNDRHGDRSADTGKRQPEVEVVNNLGLLHVNTLRPVGEDTGLLQEGVGNDVGANGRDEGTDHDGERQHETNQNGTKV